jgi:hypothetical protein
VIPKTSISLVSAENSIQSSVIAITRTNANMSAARVNSKIITKDCSKSGTQPNCPVLPFSFQRKSLRRNVVRILQCEQKTLHTFIRLEFIQSRFPLQRSETPENVPFLVQNQCQSVWVTVTSAVKPSRRNSAKISGKSEMISESNREISTKPKLLGEVR